MLYDISGMSEYHKECDCHQHSKSSAGLVLRAGQFSYVFSHVSLLKHLCSCHVLTQPIKLTLQFRVYHIKMRQLDNVRIVRGVLWFVI